MEAEEPVEPEEQRKRILLSVLNEQQLILSEDDARVIKYYLTEGMCDDIFEPYPEIWIESAKKKSLSQLFEKSE